METSVQLIFFNENMDSIPVTPKLYTSISTHYSKYLEYINFDLDTILFDYKPYNITFILYYLKYLCIGLFKLKTTHPEIFNRLMIELHASEIIITDIYELLYFLLSIIISRIDPKFKDLICFIIKNIYYTSELKLVLGFIEKYKLYKNVDKCNLSGYNFSYEGVGDSHTEGNQIIDKQNLVKKSISDKCRKLFREELLTEISQPEIIKPEIIKPEIITPLPVIYFNKQFDPVSLIPRLNNFISTNYEDYKTNFNLDFNFMLHIVNPTIDSDTININLFLYCLKNLCKGLIRLKKKHPEIFSHLIIDIFKSEIVISDIYELLYLLLSKIISKIKSTFKFLICQIMIYIYNDAERDSLSHFIANNRLYTPEKECNLSKYNFSYGRTLDPEIKNSLVIEDIRRKCRVMFRYSLQIELLQHKMIDDRVLTESDIHNIMNKHVIIESTIPEINDQSGGVIDYNPSTKKIIVKLDHPYLKEAELIKTIEIDLDKIIDIDRPLKLLEYTRVIDKYNNEMDQEMTTYLKQLQKKSTNQQYIDIESNLLITEQELHVALKRLYDVHPDLITNFTESIPRIKRKIEILVGYRQDIIYDVDTKYTEEYAKVNSYTMFNSALLSPAMFRSKYLKYKQKYMNLKAKL